MKIRNGKSILGQIARISFDVFLTLYLIHHILGGKYGLFAQRNMGVRLLKGENMAKKMESNIKKKRNRVERLKKNNLDLDLFEEEIRKNVGIIGSDEIVVIIDN
ncbi:MAG: hypothetical protein LBB13_03765 [Rickettsiales bacterium]|jgi:cell division protein FtsB|nr:hypothetical protein [Rickettsiales bacterium]